MTTVTVGTQVSGIVQELYADFNSIVKKGQVIARLDPSILQTQVETAAGEPGQRRMRTSSARRSRSTDAKSKLDARAGARTRSS